MTQVGNAPMRLAVKSVLICDERSDARDVRRDDQVGRVPVRVLRRQRLLVEDVEVGAPEPAFTQGRQEG